MHLPGKVDKLYYLQVNSAKYLCLKAITLFTPSALGLSDPVHMENLQEKAQVALTEYIRPSTFPSHSTYYRRLLL